MRGCGDYNNHHTVYTCMAEFIIYQGEMSQSGVPWKLSPLAVDQQHCLEESCHSENGTCIVLVFTTFLTSTPPSPSPSPPHTYCHIFHMSTTSSNAHQVKNHWYG